MPPFRDSLPGASADISQSPGHHRDSHSRSRSPNRRRRRPSTPGPQDTNTMYDLKAKQSRPQANEPGGGGGLAAALAARGPRTTTSPPPPQQRLSTPTTLHSHRTQSSRTPLSDSPSTSRSRKRSSSTVVENPSALAAPRLQEHLLHAAHFAKDLEVRNQDLEDENKKLKELLRQHRTSALDWCSVAKNYQQDRNFMALQLAELELQITKKSTRKEGDSASSHLSHQQQQRQHQQDQQKRSHHPIESSATDSSSNRPTTTAAAAAAGNQTRQHHDEEEEVLALSTLVSHSISQILDYMAPSKSPREPRLPRLSKGNYSIRNTDGSIPPTGQSSSTTTLKSALKTSTSSSKAGASSSSTCICGCQEELKAWKARCDYAENQATLLEMRCERKDMIMEGYKVKWTQWKETVVREQYQRRMKQAMSPQAARYMSLRTSQPLQADQAQERSLNFRPVAEVFSTRDDVKRTRFGTAETDTSQQRREATERNTFLNQFQPRYLKDSNSPSQGRSAGTGSAVEPHVLDTDDSDDAAAEYGEQNLSLTFPSDLALRRRQHGHSELEDEEDEDVDEQGGDGQDREDIQGFSDRGGGVGRGGRGVKSKQTQFRSISPTARASEARSQRRATGQQQLSLEESRSIDQLPRRPSSSPGVETDTNLAALLNVESDRSSPPMFDSADFITTSTPIKNRTKAATQGPAQEQDPNTSTDLELEPQEGLHTPKALTVVRGGASAGSRANHTSASTSHAAPTAGVAGNGVSPGVTFVPETPLELQGITPGKQVQRQQPEAMPESPPAFVPATVQRTSERHLQPTSETITVDLEEEIEGSRSMSRLDVHSQIMYAEEPNKENVAPEEDSAHECLDMGASEDEVSHTEQGRGAQQDGAQRLPRQQHRQYHQQQQLRHRQQPTVAAPGEQLINFTERRKDKRKQMHGHDCTCCRRFYELTGPLPLPDGYNAFFTPAPRPGEKEVWEKSAEERLQDRIQQISRHRVHHEAPLTPPGFWDTDFPPTPDRVEWDRIAEERRETKKQRIEYQQRQEEQQRQKQQQQKRR